VANKNTGAGVVIAAGEILVLDLEKESGTAVSLWGENGTEEEKKKKKKQSIFLPWRKKKKKNGYQSISQSAARDWVGRAYLSFDLERERKVGF